MIRSYRAQYHSGASAQKIITKLHNLKPISIKIGMNIDNYLYRNGVFNKATALQDAKKNINKHADDSIGEEYHKEYRIIKNTDQQWFENYGSRGGSHDTIKISLDKWKIDGLLNSLLAELYTGNYNEGSVKDLMKKS